MTQRTRRGGNSEDFQFMFLGDVDGSLPDGLSDKDIVYWDESAEKFKIMSGVGQALAATPAPSGANPFATLTAIAPRLGYASPLDYGAVGDGTTDDTTAVSNAAATGRLYVPAGYTFKVVSTITVSSNFFVIGEGTIKFEPAAADNLFEISGATRVTLRDFRITSGNGNPVDAISITNGISITIDSVTIDGLRSGPAYSFTGAAIRITSTLPSNSWGVHVSGCILSSLSGSGLVANGDSTGYIEMSNVVITQCDGYGVRIDSTEHQSVQINGGVIQGCYLGTFNATGLVHTRLIGVGFENAAGLNVPSIVISGATSKSEIVIENCSIGSIDASYSIDITGGSPNTLRSVRISNNSFFGKAGKKVFHSEFAVSAVSFMENDLSGFSSTDIRTLIDFTYAQSVIVFDTSGFDIYSVGAPATVNYPNIRLLGPIRTAGLPTSSAGLSAGDLWVDTTAGNVIKVV